MSLKLHSVIVNDYLNGMHNKDLLAKYGIWSRELYNAYCTNKGVWFVRYNGNRIVRQIADWLYMNSTCHLQRKYLRYCGLMEYTNSSKKAA